MTEAIIAFVAVVQTAIGCIVGYAVARRRGTPLVERAVLPNPRGLRTICMLHVFDDKDGVVHTTTIPSPCDGAAVAWPAVRDAVADAAGRIACGASGTNDEADVSRLMN